MGPAVFLGLGSNLGDREAAIEGALSALSARGFRATLRSSLWLTEPVGGPPQGWFLNAAAGVETALAPLELLAAALEVEREMGRVRVERNGPRAIDVDVLLYGDRRIDEPGLTLPHPRITDRGFVLLPLAEIAPEMEIPGKGRVSDLAAQCPDQGVEKLA
jgi:2-amino-4-hydroxy-6-hydroxymethyldihydropteridine diphosphokinase